MADTERDRLAQLPDAAEPIRLPAKDDALNLHAVLNVRAAVEALAHRLPGIKQIHMFGSRRFRSGSVRSDIDLLVVGENLPIASVVASIAREIDSYLDVFIVHHGVAQSAVNDSVIVADGFEALAEKLQAVLVWNEEGRWVGGEDLAVGRVLVGFNPPYTLASVPHREPLVTPAEILFVCALQEEYTAIVSELDEQISAPLGSSAYFQLGTIATRRSERKVAACVADRAGTVPAAITTFRGIEMFRPRLVMLVGITAGVEGKLDLGDLIVPDTIVEYEATRIGLNDEDPHGRRHPIHPTSIEAIKAWPAQQGWLQKISSERPIAGDCRLSTDAMASGNKVVASAERAALIAKSTRKVSAIEMESLGVVEACLRSEPAVPALVVKAVSDLADERKDDAWHPFAASAAARLATDLIREEVV